MEENLDKNSREEKNNPKLGAWSSAWHIFSAQ